MTKPVKVCITSLGCAKNLVDTEVMLGSLAEHGASFTTDLRQADIQLINTCAFIDQARSESADAIDAAERWKKKKRNRKVIVAGCMAQRQPERVKARFPGVDLIIGLEDFARIGERLPSLYGELANFRLFPAADLPVYLYDETTPRLVVTPGHYAYLKIAEGCNMKCSFCAIPTFRGLERSRSVESIATEAQRLLDAGARELILVSQNSSRYGLDRRDGSTLAALLRRLDQLAADEYWIRVLYLYPTSVADELIEAYAESRHVLPYIDIPLQHASDRVLKRMRRGIFRAQIESLLDDFRRRLPKMILRTTFLVGHPGEEEADFEILREFVQQQRFDRFGVFTYSREESTHAYPWTDFAAPELAAARKAQLLEIQQGISQEKNDQLVGQRLRIIIDDLVADDESEMYYGIGRSAGDAPNADNVVRFSSGTALTGQTFCDVLITAAEPYDLYGECVAGAS